MHGNCTSRVASMVVLALMLAAGAGPGLLRAQSADEEVRSYVDKLEKGQIEDVRKVVPELAAKYQNHPGVMYLQGRLASNGIEAVKLYQTVVTNFPKCEWADAALYRIYQYYYAMRLFRQAEAKLEQLKSDYPNSPYTSMAAAEKIPVQKEKAPPVVQRPPDLDTAKLADTSSVHIVPPPPSRTRAVRRPAERHTKYTLQVGAFTTAPNAEKQKKFFESHGYSVEVMNKVRSGKSLFVVWLGSFDDPNEAKKVGRQVKAKYRINSMVVER